MKTYLSFLCSLALSFSILAQTNSDANIKPYFTAIIVSDISNSIDWYTQNLGLEVKNQIENEARGFKQANLGKEGMAIELIELNSAVAPQELMEDSPKGTKLTGFFKVGFSISQFDDTIERLKDSGVTFHGDVVKDPVSSQKMVVLKDPDGNRIQLFEAQNDTVEAEAIIRKNIVNFSKQLMAGNYDAVVDAYTKDAKIFPGGRDILHNSEAIRNYWTPPADRKSKLIYHKVTPEEIKILGNEAYDWGYYEGKTLMGDGTESSWRGKYVITWKEVEPKVWKIYLDIWNRVP